ncbi:MAG: TVP38/TMEM64 family protein [Acidobacteria bacterium]|nr:TVP38/TMEM64 family protein [Acidobacteriota bacterium]
MKKSAWKWIALVAFVVALVVAARVLPVTGWLKDFSQWVRGLGALGYVLFVLVYIAATVLFVPGFVLTVGAGFAFGLLPGVIAVSVASTIGAALAFLIARYIARGKIEAMAQKNKRFKAIDRAIGEQGAKLIFLLRLSPLIPFNLSNYFYGLTGVKFWPYVLASWVGMLPGTLLYVYLGAAGKAGVEAAAKGEAAARSPWEWTLFGVGLVATLVVTIIVTRIARNALKRNKVT